MKWFTKSLALTLLILGALSCSNKKEQQLIWLAGFPVIGSQSSPRTVDLNNDGVLDIVMGAGKNEYQKTKQGILAINGKTGDILWQHEADDQVYGSATFYDVTGDGTADVFIGGRSPYFKAIDGQTGKLIWQYQYQYENDSILKHARFNFNNSLLVPDQNSDGLKDIVTVNGGNSKALPGSTNNRYPGVMILFDSKTGTILAADTMPDGGETYMSPSGFFPPNSDQYQIMFGTGGETIAGNLYRCTLKDLMEQKLSNSTLLASEKGHGFIAPASLADFSGDGYPDIAVISHGSTVIVIDGQSNKTMWEQKISGTESSNSLAVGHFNEDKTPDLFTFVSQGEWPNNTGSQQIMLNGLNGKIEYKNALGCTGFSSPVVYDLNHDGVDEAIISINEFDCNQGFTTNSIAEIRNKLIALNFRDKTLQILDDKQGFKNIFSTPWVGDLDNDGYVDIIHCQYFSRGGLLAFLGMQVKRTSLSTKIVGQVPWGAYMGTAGDGLYTVN
jgi:outer membrane protein assembly factor BamB